MRRSKVVAFSITVVLAGLGALFGEGCASGLDERPARSLDAERLAALEALFEGTHELRFAHAVRDTRVTVPIPGGVLDFVYGGANPAEAGPVPEGELIVPMTDLRVALGMSADQTLMEIPIADLPAFLLDQNQRSLCGDKKVLLLMEARRNADAVSIALEVHIRLDEGIASAAAYLGEGSGPGGDAGAGADAGSGSGPGSNGSGSGSGSGGNNTTPPPPACSGGGWGNAHCSGYCPPDPQFPNVSCVSASAGGWAGFFGYLTCVCQYTGYRG